MRPPGHHTIPYGRAGAAARGGAEEEKFADPPPIQPGTAAPSSCAVTDTATATRQLIEMKRTYPAGPFIAAFSNRPCGAACFKSGRLKSLILDHLFAAARAQEKQTMARAPSPSCALAAWPRHSTPTRGGRRWRATAATAARPGEPVPPRTQPGVRGRRVCHGGSWSGFLGGRREPRAVQAPLGRAGPGNPKYSPAWHDTVPVAREGPPQPWCGFI